MDASLQILIDRLNQLSEQFEELRDGIREAIDVVSVSPKMALVSSRRVLEYVVHDVYERRIKEPPGTRPLENLLDRLRKDRFLPELRYADASSIRMLGNIGAHSWKDRVTTAQAEQSLTQLMQILEWYFEFERPDAKVRLDLPHEIHPARAEPETGKNGLTSKSEVAVVPKGLRSFDAHDSRFFLQLLPGPRDEHGLPESIRFWKNRIESGDLTFTVGVIYGPSGCGKSSLMKAGLLPRLDARILSIYVESSPDQTEASLLTKIRNKVPAVPSDLSLIATITALRQGTVFQDDRKVLIVLDQFEQWLHARRGETNTELVKALGQCDGVHVQCLVMVRDDFWLALSRFLGELDIPLVVGENAVLIDLFDPIHSRVVLTMFGRAYGHLPKESSDFSAGQNAFLDQAVRELTEDGKVISVRLALFAEMIKGKPWSPATLKEVGGTQGVGVTFLEETFSAPTAPPEHRLHQTAARLVLKALLPESGTDIKGEMKSEADLLKASGYAARPRDFAGLLRILDGELRLITPTDPEGIDSDHGSRPTPGGKFYQLTHDYLVHSLREWLTRKQRETRRGRAELRLADRAALWNAKPENRFLPSALEWVRIRALTKKNDWTRPQRTMMRKAGRVHGARVLGLALILALITWGGWEMYGSLKGSALAESVTRVDIGDVPYTVGQMAGYRRWANPRLRSVLRRAPSDSQKKLHASLALLPDDPGQVEYLYDRMLNAGPTQLPVIREALRKHQGTLSARLWTVLEDPQGQPDRRFRAACALALYDAAGSGTKWQTTSRLVTDRLLASVLTNPSHYTPLIETLRPVRNHLLDSLAATFRDAKKLESERALATNILADYAADRPDVLTDLLRDAGPQQFATLFPKVQAEGSESVRFLEAELRRKAGDNATDDQRDKLAQRQARAAVALVRLGQPERAWPLLKHSPDPSTRSYIVNWLSPLGAEPNALITKLVGMPPGDSKPTPKDGQQVMDAVLFHPEISVRRALILALGRYEPEDRSLGERVPLVSKLVELYRDDPDAGIHGAAEWTLRRWKEEEKLGAVDAGLKTLKDRGGRRWYVNSQGQSLAIIDGPVNFAMGSPDTETGRFDNELLHGQPIRRRFAVAAKEVTVAQYQEYVKMHPGLDHASNDRYSTDPKGPMNVVTWYHAAAYCNWLSEQEGLETCYAPNQKGEYAEGMKGVADFLDRSGYRLPTEAEWEYACRAGANTSRYYGRSTDLLGTYAWFLSNAENHAWPCGQLPPNDLGLFDMLGNLWEWCQDGFFAYRPGDNDDGDKDNIYSSLLLINKDIRLLRGGTFNNPAAVVRAANRLRDAPSDLDTDYGFRPSRTYP